MNKSVKLMILVAFTAVSCGESTDTPTEQKMPITITGEVSPMLKVAESGFEHGDIFSTYIAESNAFDSNVKHKNLKHTKGASGWTPERAIYWKDGSQNIWVWGIYPYQSTTLTSPMTFAVQADQSTRESDTKLSGYELSDLLLSHQADVTPTETAITLKFNHVLSKISIELESPDLDVTSGAVVKIGNLNLSSSIDLSTQVVTVDQTQGVVIAQNNSGVHHRAIVQPSTVTDLTFSVEIGGMLFEKSFGETTLVAGKQHNFKLTLKNGAMIINGGSIGNWVEGGNTNSDIKPF